MEIAHSLDSIVSSCGIKVTYNKLVLLRFSLVAKTVFFNPFKHFVALRS